MKKMAITEFCDMASQRLNGRYTADDVNMGAQSVASYRQKTVRYKSGKVVCTIKRNGSDALIGDIAGEQTELTA
jgi:hypothetical protein